MQIDESGKNRKMTGSFPNIWESQSKKNGDKISWESFHDKLHKNMNPQVTSISAKETNNSGIHIERLQAIPNAKDVQVRSIPYSECDKVEIHILEGFTLKAKLDTQKNNSPNECRIYVEKKDENGSMQACLFDAHSLHKDSQNAMEQIAYDVMKSISAISTRK